MYSRHALLFLLLTGLNGQTPQKADYSQEAYVVERNATEFNFQNDGTDSRRTSVRVRIQSDAGLQRFAILTFPYQSATESVEFVHVHVLKPDSSLVDTPLDTAQDIASEVTRQAPLYSDLREKHLAVKGLSVGDVLEYEVRSATTKPLVPGQFWGSYSFSNEGIVLDESLLVSVPRSRAVKWRSAKLKPTIEETETRRVFSWTYSLTARKSKAQEQREQQFAAYQGAQGKNPQADVLVSSFQSWEEVGRWYNSLQEDRAKPTPEIRAKAADLTKGLNNDREKAGAIYSYVSTQIHYIGIDLGIGRYQPHSAGEVLSNQYGDCKDKHTLLAALLNAIGIQAWPALIGASHDLEPDVPSPAQFDHVVSAVWLDNHLTWLDTTAEVSPFAYMLSPLRGKSALLISTDKPPALVTTPADPSTPTVETFRIDSKLSNEGVLQGKIDWTVAGGDGEVLIRMTLRAVPMPQWKDFVQQFSYAAGFAGDISDATVSPPEKTSEPLHISYSYLRKDFPSWSDRRIGSPLPPMRLPVPDKDIPQLTPVWLGSPSETIYESHVELPKGYGATAPPNLDLVEKFAEYHRTYSVRAGVLSTERRYTVKLHEVPAAEIEPYRKFASAMSADTDKTVSLSNAASSPDAYQSEIWDLPYSENAEAARAYDDARDKFTKGDLQGVIASLQHAVAMDPKFTRAWLWLGDVYKQTRRTEEAIAAYKKGITSDPQQAVAYKALGVSLMSLRRPAEAIAVWQQLIQAVPGDSAGPEGLGGSLFALQRYAEANVPLETAARMNPDNSRISLELGAAYVRTGDAKKGIIEFQKALRGSYPLPVYSHAAFELADTGQELDTALAYAKLAVRDETVASRKVDLTQLHPEDLLPTFQLQAYWDTLGWVYFKMGKLDQAETYLNSSFALGQDARSADHLGQLFERQGKKQAAIRMYKIAVSRSESPGPWGQESPPDLEIGKTKSRLEHLAPGLSDPDFRSSMDISTEVSKMRTTKVEFTTKEEGSAVFYLLFSPEKVEAVKFGGGLQSLTDAETAVKSTLFKIPMPADGDPRILRKGVLYCSPLTGCSFTLMNSSDVFSSDFVSQGK